MSQQAAAFASQLQKGYSRNAMPPQVAQILNKTEKHLHNMFLAGAIMAALSCFARADYNLPMFAFLYIMWDQDDVS
jgi:uncharacterized membrane protein